MKKIVRAVAIIVHMSNPESRSFCRQAKRVPGGKLGLLNQLIQVEVVDELSGLLNLKSAGNLHLG